MSFVRTLRKNILREFKSSFPRFISLTILLALGTFVLIGLKITGGDMRATGNQYFRQHKMADAQVTSPIGFNQADKKYLSQMKHVKQIEYSIYQDALVADSRQTIRLNQKTSRLSIYRVVQGRLPRKANEIALSKYEQGHYHLGQQLELVNNQGKSRVTGLKYQHYKIVGFVTSSDYLQKDNLGTSKAGKGQINTFGVLTKAGFSKQAPNVAKLSFNNLHGQSYTRSYEKKLNQYVDQDAVGLAQRADKRQAELKQTKQSQLQKAQQSLAQKAAILKQKQTELSQVKAQLDLSEQQVSQTAQLQAKQEQWQQNSAKLKRAQQKLARAKQKLVQKKQQLKQMSGITYQLQARNDYNQGYNQFGEAAARVDVLSNTFPVIFFAVAILVTLTTMTRMAEEKRTDIGLLRALGYTKFDALKLFLTYGTSAAVIGTVIGGYFGTWLLPDKIYAAYSANLAVPSLQTPPSWLWIGVSLLCALLCTVEPALYVVWKSLQEQPANLLTEKSPKAGTKVLLERLPFIWKKLSFNQKVTMRNLFRYKSRMFMTVVGIFGCTALLITGFGMRDSINGIVDNQYQRITHYDVIGVYNQNASQSEKEAYFRKVTDLKGVAKQARAYFEAVTVRPQGLINNQQVSLIVPRQPRSFDNFISLRDVNDQQRLSLPKNGAVITAKLAKLGHYQVGDRLSLTDSSGRKRTVRISGIAEMYAGHDLLLSGSYYRKVFGKKIAYNAQILNLKDRSAANIDRVSRQLNSQKAAVTAVQSNQAKMAINTVLDGLNNIVWIIVLASSALSFVVLFTLTNINVSERTRELATLRVLGFYQRETVLYIYRETAILTVLGIIVGFGGGYYLHHFIMETLPPNNALADMTLHWTNLGLSTALTLLFSVIVMIIMVRKIRRIDMLGALNSAD